MLLEAHSLRATGKELGLVNELPVCVEVHDY